MSELSDLFAKDPLSLTTEGLQETVAKYRASRAAWLSGAGKAVATKAAKVERPAGKLSLGDLEL